MPILNWRSKLQRQVHEASPHCWLPRAGMRQHGVSRRFHTRSRQAHQASEPRGYPVGWRGPHAAKLRADEEASRGVERNPASGRNREAGHLSGFCGGRVRRSQAPSAPCSRFVLQSADRGVRPTDDLESLQCVHERVQGTRSDPTVQGYCEARTFYRVGSRSGELIATSQCNGPCIARETRPHSVRCRSLRDVLRPSGIRASATIERDWNSEKTHEFDGRRWVTLTRLVLSAASLDILRKAPLRWHSLTRARRSMSDQFENEGT